MRTVHDAARDMIETLRQSDEPFRRQRDQDGVAARLRTAILPPVVLSIASEAEMGTDPNDFGGASCEVLASIVSALAGYLGSGPDDQTMPIRLLEETADMFREVASGELKPVAVYAETFKRDRRGEDN